MKKSTMPPAVLQQFENLGRQVLNLAHGENNPTDRPSVQAAAESIFSDFASHTARLIQQYHANDPDSIGLRLLCAIYLNDIGVIRCILDSDNDLAEYGPLSAMSAAGLGRDDAVELLIEKHLNWFTDPYFTKPIFPLPHPIHAAAMNNRLKVVEKLLPHTPKEVLNRPFLRNALGPIPPLLWSVVRGNYHEMLALLLKFEPDLEIIHPENHDSTALTQACFDDHAECALLLIDAGANIHATGSMGGTSLHSTAVNGNTLLTWKLLKAGADPNALSTGFGTPLHLAAIARPMHTTKKTEGDYDNVVRMLLMHKADVNRRHPLTNSTALHGACESEEWLIAQQLIVAGANAFAQDISRNTPTSIAQSHGKNNLTEKIALKRKIEERKTKALTEQISNTNNPLIAAAGEEPPKHQPKKKKKKRNRRRKKRTTTSQQVQKKKYSPTKKSTPKKREAKTPNQHPAQSKEPIVVTEVPTIPETAVSVADDIKTLKPAAISNKTPTDIQIPTPEKETTRQKVEEQTSRDKTPTKIPSPKLSLATASSRLFTQPRYPTGDDRQKFPLSATGIPDNIYFVVLIPNVLNKLFSNEQMPILTKVWSAIQLGRLLPPKSKSKSGVKILSLTEQKQLQNKEYNGATHKVKPNKSDTRPYLKSKLGEDDEQGEIHLELVGVNFHAH